MMLEPAPCAGDAPRTAPEHPAPDAHPPPPPTPIRRTEERRWLDRRDLERQLHDGAALRISALTLRLGLLRHRISAGEGHVHESIGELQDELHAVLQELRDVAGRLYPPLLDQAGLGSALREAAARLGLPIHVVAGEDRFGPAAEGVAYFAVLDCLTALPPDPGAIEVEIRRGDDGYLVVLVTGVGACHASSIHDAVRAIGGTVETRRGAGSGDGVPATTITVRIPCA